MGEEPMNIPPVFQAFIAATEAVFSYLESGCVFQADGATGCRYAPRGDAFLRPAERENHGGAPE